MPEALGLTLGEGDQAMKISETKKPVACRDVWKEVAEAIGIPVNACCECSIEFPVDGVVTVKASYYLTVEEVRRLVDARILSEARIEITSETPQ